jgi:predicted ATP-dependent protease
LEEIQSSYADIVYNFYHSNVREKDSIIKDIQRKRNEMINYLFDIAKAEGFEVKATKNGFSFMPIKEGEAMTERDFDDLDFDLKEEILNKVSALKDKAHDILEEIKTEESEGLQKIREVLLKYLVQEVNTCKSKCFCTFKNEQKGLDYLKFVCENIEKRLVEVYSTSYEVDEEKFNEVIYKYCVNILVDSSDTEASNVIFEEDPTLNNLMGTIEYESHNGNYITDISLIKAGSLLKANGGCLILRVSSLFSNSASYIYLKKTLLSGKLKFDHSRGYLELLTLNSLKPAAIDVNLKVVLIGDYETFDILYNMDEDFKKIFRIKLQYDPEVENTESNNKVIIEDIRTIIKENNMLDFEESAIREVFRYLSRKVGSRKKYIYDEIEINKILTTVDKNAKKMDKNSVKAVDLEKTLYEKELVEKHILESYKDSRILLPIEDKLIGSINGLSVIDLGYTSFGRPLRITCSCYKGDGNIIDVQKESNLSGNIHNKSINILKGLINKLFGGYSSIPVDFHISFEQIYGKVEGDSASVAEMVAIISALSKLPINQGIAVTGSINQFGEVQPIGGINEKIEGFYDICKLKGGVKDKGVLLPKSNVENIVLRPDVEEAVDKGIFNLYVMENIEDALMVLIGDDKIKVEDIMAAAAKEIKKYNARSKS